MVILLRKFAYATDVEDTSEEESSEDRYGSSLLCWQPLSPSLDDGGVGGDTGGLPRWLIGGLLRCPQLEAGDPKSMTRFPWYGGHVEVVRDCVGSCVGSCGLGGGVTVDEVDNARRRWLRGFRTKNTLGMLNTAVG